MPYKDKAARNANWRERNRWRMENDPEYRERRCRYSREARERDPERARTRARKDQAERRRRIDTYKTAPCVDCGGTFPPCAMEFHHRDPTQKLRGKDFRQQPIAVVEAEIAKCDLLCSNCHRIRHHAAK